MSTNQDNATTPQREQDTSPTAELAVEDGMLSGEDSGVERELARYGQEEDGEEEGEGEGEGEDGAADSDLVLLDPSHPLMQRVQAALKDQLTRQNEKLTVELREKQKTLKITEEDRERLGVELYNVQQQLARQQMLLEKEQDNHKTNRTLRDQREATLGQVREMYRAMQGLMRKKRQQTIQLRQEVEGVTSTLHFLAEAHHTVQSDIAVTKRATEKTTTDVSKAQEEKLNQDLYLDRLTSQVANLDEQFSLYDAQYRAQAQETRAVKESLTEASMELETLQLEKKQLLQQWNSTLIGMRRRDEAYAAMLSAVNHQRQQVRSLETEIEKYKKSITQEQERNEQLTLILNKVRADIMHVERQLETSRNKHEQLKKEYMTLTRTLQETEQSLAKVNTDCLLKRNELGAIRTQIEREALEKRKLEDAVMEKMMQQLTMDKSTRYTRKSLEKLHSTKQELETTVVEVDNEIAKSLLLSSHLSSQLRQLQSTADQQQSAIEQKNRLISQSEAEIGRSNALIERKQTQIDQLNKKISQKMSKMDGGEDLGPLELKVASLQKQTADSVQRCASMQQHWLRQQNELVRKTRQAEEEAAAVDSLKKQQLILEQKKLRIDGHLEREEGEQRRVHQSISRLQHEMVRLSTVVAEKRGEQEKLEQGNILMQNDFIHSLKASELECIQMQSKLEQVKEEKERLLNSLLEAEQQILLWERKIQLAKEMRNMVDSETGQAELRAMKAEIHRMEVHYEQLMRQQEKLIQDMEKAVYRREAIMLKGEALTKAGKREHTQGQLKRKIADLQRQIKQTAKDSSRCEEEGGRLLSSQQVVGEELENGRQVCQHLITELEDLDREIEHGQDRRREEMAEFVSGQARYKQLVAVREGRYRMLAKSKAAREAERERQLEKLQSLQAVVNKLHTDFPDTQEDLKTVTSALERKLDDQQHKQRAVEVA